VQLLDDGTVVFSASDLTAASACEWALMRSLDAMRGKAVIVPAIDDPMLERAGKLGDVHEKKVLHSLEAELGPAVEITRPSYGSGNWREDMNRAAAETEAALRAGAPLVFQGAFFDGEFQGYSDFLVRSDEGPAYEVWDSKLARHAKLPALLQLAAYVDQLRKIGIDASDTVRLVLGDQEQSVHDVADILPVYLHRRARLRELIDGRLDDPDATYWGDPRYTACGRCAVCAPEVESHRDLLLVAGMKLTQRALLIDSGIETIDELAASSTSVEGMPHRTLAALKAQASIQLEATEASTPFTVFAPQTLASIPPEDAGDIFFDFEGDPLYEEKRRWGLDYLFGVYGAEGEFTTFWAEDLAEEKAAFVAFMGFVASRRAAHPGMHIYHYASYEKTHLLSLAVRHDVFERDVDDLLRQNVLVDLYPIVRRSVRVGSHSYSIKKLEPLYMGEEHRTGTASAVDSVQQFADYSDARDAGDTAEAARLRADIVQYNRYDCLSTLRLRDWLVGLAREHGVEPGTADAAPERLPDIPDPTYTALTELVADVAVEDRTPLQEAIALAAAAIDYHRREDKKFWQEHFARLLEPDESVFGEQRGVLLIDSVEVVEDWHKPSARSGIARTLRITGTPAPGTRFSLKNQPYVLYDAPHPPVVASPPLNDPAMRLGHNRLKLLEIEDEGTLLVSERLGDGGDEHSHLPVALTPPGPIRVTGQKESILEWGGQVLAAQGDFADPAFEILMRNPPRGALAPVEGDAWPAIVTTLLGLDRSYVAVQGPPGSGKTFVGSHVIADLVARGWRIGVVAQAHATVQNVLKAVIERGVDPGRVGKVPVDGDAAAHPWTELTATSAPRFLAQPGGYVFGGTAWTFTNAALVPHKHFDLLVIDEAGQYSLANTIAVSRAATNLLLLGDPQQLPQVTVGSHPEPINESALGWLSAGHDVLPDELGYFLPQSWRMDAALSRPVSRLSYAGRLRSAAATANRSLKDVAPGLHDVPVEHRGNATSSPEEADAVVALVRGLIGTPWTDAGTAPLTQHDFIVVAPYNAQVDLIADRLAAAGLGDVSVGSVDKFQGHEAVISIVSLAASSAAEVPRGIEFLLMPNRLNVAISRAKWAAYLVHSPALADHLPSNAENLAVLGRYLRLLGDAV
jgi:predicted RecB family nuclease